MLVLIQIKVFTPALRTEQQSLIKSHRVAVLSFRTFIVTKYNYIFLKSIRNGYVTIISSTTITKAHRNLECRIVMKSNNDSYS